MQGPHDNDLNFPDNDLNFPDNDLFAKTIICGLLEIIERLLKDSYKRSLNDKQC
jgi:hypothetical protein